MRHSRESSGVRRRELLGAGAALTTGLAAGCLQRVRSLVDRPGAEQVSLEIKTLPADADEPATRIARVLDEHLSAAGIDTEITLLRDDELRRDVLTKGEFEVYVDQMPLEPDPDFLRPRLHSVFVGESGWQNPFGLADLELDELVTDQRRLAGAARMDRVAEIQEWIARYQPFVPVAVPDEIAAVRTDRFEGWRGAGLASPADFLALDHREDGLAGELRVTTTDDRITENLNPLAVTDRNRDQFTGLLYEPLGRRIDDAVRPWLATDWEWNPGGEGTDVRVRLREGLTWHDGRSLSAADVAFTYRFMRDTTLGTREAAVPAPRFRGRTSLVRSVAVEGPRTVRIDVGEASPEVGARALTVPVLPEHVWRSKSVEAELAGVGVNDLVTEALVWANPEPVGSGPLAFERQITGEGLILRRYNGHFLHRDGPAPVPDVAGGVDFTQLSVRVAPSSEAAVQLVAADEADATVPMTDPAVAPRIARAEALSLSVDRAPSLYHVGLNARIEPLGNPHVRRAIARALDKAAIVDEVFDGYAQPAASPLAGTDWLAPSLAWDGEDPEVPFIGTDGQLDAEGVREAFRDAGFQYQDDRLLSR